MELNPGLDDFLDRLGKVAESGPEGAESPTVLISSGWKRPFLMEFFIWIFMV
jgi:hypothetical protein